MAENSKVAITLLEGAASNRSLSELWDCVLGVQSVTDFYQSYEWYQAVVKLTADTDVKNCVVQVEVEGQTVALIPIQVVNRRGRLGTYSQIQIAGNIYTPRRWVLVLPDKRRLVARVFVEWLNEGPLQWHRFVWADADHDDELLHSLNEEFRRRGPTAVYSAESNVFTDLSGFAVADDFYRSLSKNTRKNIARSINKLARDFDVVVCRIDEHSKQIQQALDDYYLIYGRSWKEPERYPEFHRELSKVLGPRSSLRLYLMYLGLGGSAIDARSFSRASAIRYDSLPNSDYVPVAAYYFLKLDNRAYFLKTAYDEKYAKHSPGTALLWYAIRDLRDVERCTVIDHQKGDDPYKAKWGNRWEGRVKLISIHGRAWRLRLEYWLGRIRRLVTIFLGRRDG